MEFIIVMIGIWIFTFLLYALIDFIIIAIYVLWSMSLMQVFAKFNEEAWKALIPGYNIYIVLQAAELNKWYTAIVLLPTFGKLGWVAFYIFIIYFSVMLAKKFGKKRKFLNNMVIAPPLYMHELGKDGSLYSGNYKTNSKESNK